MSKRLKEILSTAKENDDIKKHLSSNLGNIYVLQIFFALMLYYLFIIAYLTFPLIEHCLTMANFPEKILIGKNFDINGKGFLNLIMF